MIRELAIEAAIGAGVTLGLWLFSEALAQAYIGCSAFTC
jgi:hypothetical protein